MRRRIFPAIAILSLACSVALVGLWAASWRWELFVRYVDWDGPWTAIARCEYGTVVGVWWTSSPDNRLRGLYGGVILSVFRPGDIGARLRAAAVGFEVTRGAIGAGVSTVVTVPLWPAIVLTAIPPAIWWRQRRRRLTCGFPVEATEDA